MSRKIERMACRLTRWCGLAVSLGGAIGVGASAHAGQAFQWTASGGGSWFAPANWAPVGVPSIDSDTATIDGVDPLVIEVAGANATVGILNLTNPAAELRVRSGTIFTLANAGTLNGTLSVGDSLPGTFTQFIFRANVGTIAGTGRLLMRAPAGDPTRAQFLAASPRTATWSKDITIEGAGSLHGKHQIPGAVNANAGAGSALEFRSGSIDGLGTGLYTADGAVLRLFQSTVSNARIETRNGGRFELSAPTLGGVATTTLLDKAVVRGTMRTVLNTTFIQDTDFEGLMEIPAGTSVRFVGPARVMKMTAQVGGSGGNPASLWLGTGTPAGNGEIFLNAVTNPDEAAVVVNGAELGADWRVHGHGTISGSAFINTTIAVEGPLTVPLRFANGTIDGTGTLEARGGVLEFGSSSKVRNLRLTSTQGGLVRVVDSGNSGTWTGVHVDTPFEITDGELVLENVTVNGGVHVKSGSIVLGQGTTVIDGDILLEPWNTTKVYLASRLGGVLAGSGRIDIHAVGATTFYGSGILFAEDLTISESRSIHGEGVISGKVKVLGPLYVDGIHDIGLRLTGAISGAGTNTIEISTGKLTIAQPYEFPTPVSPDPVDCSSFRIVGLEGSAPLQVGNGLVQFGNSTLRVGLTDMDIDAESVLSQKYVDLTSSTFRRKVLISAGTTCRVFAGCRFDGDVVVSPSIGTFAPTVLEFRNDLPSINRLVFVNIKSNEPSGLLSSQQAGTFAARVVGTGSISAPFSLAGVLAPSDESTGGPIGRLLVSDFVMKLTTESVYEADVVSTEVFDRIDAPKGVWPNGTLRITAAPDFYPPPSFDFDLIRGEATGSFITVIGPAGFRTSMTYNSVGVLARFEKICGSDLNSDGLVDDADFVIFCPAYNAMSCTDPSMPENCPSDLNRDGVVDDADFQIFVGAYEEMVCPEE